MKIHWGSVLMAVAIIVVVIAVTYRVSALRTIVYGQ